MFPENTDTVFSGGRIRPTTGYGYGELSDRLTRDDLFEMLSNERRRCALYYLQQQDGPVELKDVVDYVTAWQYDSHLSEIDTSERMCVYSALHQAHLPKLDEAGLIDYDSESRLIESRDELEYARLYLEYDPGNDISWSTTYVGLVGIGLVLGLANYLALAPFEWLTGSMLFWLLLALFVVASLAHTVHEWRNKHAMSELFEIER